MVSGDVFPIGTTIVTFRAYFSGGHNLQCTTTIIVVDPCVGITCDGLGSDDCHESSGSCFDGTCQYSPLADGTVCDAGNGQCGDGLCIDLCTAVVCPPPASPMPAIP